MEERAKLVSELDVLNWASKQVATVYKGSVTHPRDFDFRHWLALLGVIFPACAIDIDEHMDWATVNKIWRFLEVDRKVVSWERIYNKDEVEILNCLSMLNFMYEICDDNQCIVDFAFELSDSVASYLQSEDAITALTKGGALSLDEDIEDIVEEKHEESVIESNHEQVDDHSSHETNCASAHSSPRHRTAVPTLCVASVQPALPEEIVPSNSVSPMRDHPVEEDVCELAKETPCEPSCEKACEASSVVCPLLLDMIARPISPAISPCMSATSPAEKSFGKHVVSLDPPVDFCNDQKVESVNEESHSEMDKLRLEVNQLKQELLLSQDAATRMRGEFATEMSRLRKSHRQALLRLEEEIALEAVASSQGISSSSQSSDVKILRTRLAAAEGEASAVQRELKAMHRDMTLVSQKLENDCAVSGQVANVRRLLEAADENGDWKSIASQLHSSMETLRSSRMSPVTANLADLASCAIEQILHITCNDTRQDVLNAPSPFASMSVTQLASSNTQFASALAAAEEETTRLTAANRRLTRVVAFFRDRKDLLQDGNNGLCPFESGLVDKHLERDAALAEVVRTVSELCANAARSTPEPSPRPIRGSLMFSHHPQTSSEETTGRALKHVLSSVGMSPDEFARSFWEFAVSSVSNRDQVAILENEVSKVRKELKNTIEKSTAEICELNGKCLQTEKMSQEAVNSIKLEMTLRLARERSCREAIERGFASMQSELRRLMNGLEEETSSANVRVVALSRERIKFALETELLCAASQVREKAWFGFCDVLLRANSNVCNLDDRDCEQLIEFANDLCATARELRGLGIPLEPCPSLKELLPNLPANLEDLVPSHNVRSLVEKRDALASEARKAIDEVEKRLEETRTFALSSVATANKNMDAANKECDQIKLDNQELAAEVEFLRNRLQAAEATTNLVHDKRVRKMNAEIQDNAAELIRNINADQSTVQTRISRVSAAVSARFAAKNTNASNSAIVPKTLSVPSRGVSAFSQSSANQCRPSPVSSQVCSISSQSSDSCATAETTQHVDQVISHPALEIRKSIGSDAREFVRTFVPSSSSNSSQSVYSSHADPRVAPTVLSQPLPASPVLSPDCGSSEGVPLAPVTIRSPAANVDVTIRSPGSVRSAAVETCRSQGPTEYSTKCRGGASLIRAKIHTMRARNSSDQVAVSVRKSDELSFDPLESLGSFAPISEIIHQEKQQRGARSGVLSGTSLRTKTEQVPAVNSDLYHLFLE